MLHERNKDWLRQMARPENAPMRNASLREVGDADLLLLAERVVAG